MRESVEGVAGPGEEALLLGGRFHQRSSPLRSAPHERYGASLSAAAPSAPSARGREFGSPPFALGVAAKHPVTPLTAKSNGWLRKPQPRSAPPSSEFAPRAAQAR